MVTLLEGNLIAALIANRNVIEKGANTWRVVAAGEVTTGAYSGSVSYADPDDTNVDLTQNFDQYFGLVIKDEDRAETNIDWVSKYSERGAYQLKKDIDTLVFADHASFGANFNNASSDWQFTKDTAAEIPTFFSKLNKAVRDLDWPDEGRYLVGPAGFEEAMALYYSNRATALGDQSNTNVAPTRIMGWEIYYSNNLNTETSTTHGVAGVKGEGMALGYTLPEDAIEDLGRAEGVFGDLIRGRARGGYGVYDAKMLLDVEFNSTVVATS